MLDTMKHIAIPADNVKALEEAQYLLRQAMDRLNRVADRTASTKVENAADKAFVLAQSLDEKITELLAAAKEAE